MKIAFIVTCWKHEPYLFDCIESITNQSHHVDQTISMRSGYEDTGIDLMNINTHDTILMNFPKRSSG